MRCCCLAGAAYGQGGVWPGWTQLVLLVTSCDMQCTADVQGTRHSMPFAARLPTEHSRGQLWVMMYLQHCLSTTSNGVSPFYTRKVTSLSSGAADRTSPVLNVMPTQVHFVSRKMTKISLHRCCAQRRTPLFSYMPRVSQMPGRHSKGHVYSFHRGTGVRSMLQVMAPRKHVTVTASPMRVNPQRSTA